MSTFSWTDGIFQNIAEGKHILSSFNSKMTKYGKNDHLWKIYELWHVRDRTDKRAHSKIMPTPTFLHIFPMRCASTLVWACHSKAVCIFGIVSVSSQEPKWTLPMDTPIIRNATRMTPYVGQSCRKPHLAPLYVGTGKIRCWWPGAPQHGWKFCR